MRNKAFLEGGGGVGYKRLKCQSSGEPKLEEKKIVRLKKKKKNREGGKT